MKKKNPNRGQIENGQPSEQSIEKTENPADAVKEASAAPPENQTEQNPPFDAEPLIRNKYADRMNTKKKLPKAAKIAIGVVAAAILGGGGFFAVTKLNDVSSAVSEETAFSSLGFLETYVEGYGQTAAKRSEDLGKDIKGTVTEVLVAPGDQVTAGDTLLKIDADETRKELDEAMDAQEEAREGIESAQRSLRSANEKASSLRVTAPFAGKLIPPGQENAEGAEGETTAVSELRVQPGDELDAGTVIGLLVDDTMLRVPLYYSYAYIDKITEGMPASVSVAYTMTSVYATVEKVEKIERISPDGTKTFRVTLAFENPGTLTKDMDAIGSIEIDGEQVVPADTGKIEYSREKELTLESGGTVTAVDGLSYYRFTEGQTILQLSNPDVSDAVASASAAVEAQQKMFEQKQKRVEELQKLLEEATIVSPIDGIVIDVPVFEGEKVDGSKSVCTVADLSSIVVNASIPEIDIDKVEVGQPVQLSMDSGDMFTGSVSSISMKAETNEGSRGGASISFPIVIAVDENPEQTLSPNRSLEFKITTATSENCVTVPSSAVVYTADGAAVYVKPAEGQEFENAVPIPEGSEVPDDFVLVPIETGISDADNTEVLSGLGEGVEVFLAAPQDAYAQYEQQMASASVG